MYDEDLDRLTEETYFLNSKEKEQINKTINNLKTNKMKTAKVTNVQSNGTWQSPNGLMYKWDIDFDNGDHGQAMTKDQEHKTWIVGESVSYTLEPNKNPQYPGKLTRVKEQPQQQQKANSSDFNAPEVVTMRECIGHACVAVAQSSFCDNTQVIIKMAEDFYNAAMSKKPKTAN